MHSASMQLRACDLPGVRSFQHMAGRKGARWQVGLAQTDIDVQMGQTRRAARCTTLKNTTRTLTRHDGRSVSAGTTRDGPCLGRDLGTQCQHERTRHEKRDPFKHEGNPSKHDENRLESPLIWLAQMAHESHLCISSQTLIPYPLRSAAAASISRVRRFLLYPPPSSRPWVAAAVVGCSREAAAAPWGAVG
jgi:hypothetical protein